jgi:uncharacterized membrane protein YfcA
MPDALLPPGTGGLPALLIVATSFLGSATTAAFSIGGGLLLIAVMAAVLPAAVVVPVHGVIMVGSNAGRFAILRRAVDWPTVGWFAAGAAIGGAVGSQVVFGLPAPALRLAIAGFVLFTQWGPKVDLPLGRRSFVVAGTLSTFLTLFVGASGPFMTAVLSKMPGYDRVNLIATSGACMTLQHAAKVAIFAAAGFAYAPWAPFLALCLAAGFAGTFLGTRLLKRLDERVFRSALRWILTALAAYLLVAGVLALGQG